MSHISSGDAKVGAHASLPRLCPLIDCDMGTHIVVVLLYCIIVDTPKVIF